MGHVAPHRWADAAAGRLSESALAKAERHAADCERCARQRDRVMSTREQLEDIRDTETPSLHWDHIGARIYWVTSSERRAAERRQGDERRLRPAYVGIAAAVFATLAVAGGWLAYDHFSASDVVADEPAPPAPVPSVTPEPEVRSVKVAVASPGKALQGVVVYARGEVEVAGAPLDFDRPIRVGDRISTRVGKVSVQFGGGDGFVVPKHSTVTIKSFSERNIELLVKGEVYVDVSHNPSRHLAVIAGGRQVLVKGTAFQVGHRAGRLDVSCTRGRVIVSDGSAEVDVRAGHRLHLDSKGSISAMAASRMTADVLAAMHKRSAVPMLPVWNAALDSLMGSTSTLRIAAPTAVKVDGVEVGHGSFSLRVMSGRHHVQAKGGAGGWSKGKWLDLGAGTDISTRIRPEPSESASGRVTRRRQLQRALTRSSRLRGCLRPLQKQGLVEGSFVVLDIGIDQRGRIAHLNMLRSNLPSGVVRCIRTVVDQVDFPDGPRASVRYRLGF
jgi:hypothetical protein